MSGVRHVPAGSRVRVPPASLAVDTDGTSPFAFGRGGSSAAEWMLEAAKKLLAGPRQPLRSSGGELRGGPSGMHYLGPRTDRLLLCV